MLSYRLRDFTMDGRRLMVITGIALVLGVLSGAVAFLLLRLIGLITHLSYLGQVGFSLIAPDPAHFGVLSVLIPIVGGILVGLLARFGSAKIRGHGIPEAIQSILEHDSVIEPKVALVKPIASAITIGTGGPFGAEGPIIMTGGAIGSLIAQLLPVSSAERRTLLVAGAAGGMSATFASPVAAILLAVELLLFEWRPRSFVPVAAASVIADLVRLWLLGPGPVFAAPALLHVGPAVLPWAVLLGLLSGGLSGGLTQLVYWVEDLYRRLPIHWMWWPAIGGLVLGVGGLFFPQALGVGYGMIDHLDSGRVLLSMALGLLFWKTALWILSLSSGTSGGVLAPLLLIGGALGTLFAHLIGGPLQVYAIIGMAAVLGGTMRAPLTASVFALETTGSWHLLLPLVVATVAATALTAVFLPRSILTEKVARLGGHVAREYSVHPLESAAVSGLMVPREHVAVLEAELSAAEAARAIRADPQGGHRVYPVVSENGRVLGAVRRVELLRARAGACVGDLAEPVPEIPATARASMALSPISRTTLAVAVVIDDAGQMAGFLTQGDLLKAWRRWLAADEQREVRLRLRPRRSPR